MQSNSDDCIMIYKQFRCSQSMDCTFHICFCIITMDWVHSFHSKTNRTTI